MEASRQAVVAAKKASQEIEDLKEKHTFMSEADKVCTICGVRCNPNMESDFQAHLDGRLHEGYVKIRAEVKELREKIQKAEERKSDEKKGKDKTEEKEKGEKDDKDKSKGDREKHKGDREKHKDKADKDRDRDRDR